MLLYQRTSPLTHFNEARIYMFSTGNRKIENILLTKDALVQHGKCAIYEAGHIWEQCRIGLPQTPSPSSWGWKRQTKYSPWSPYWTTLQETAKKCQELLRCGRKKDCQRVQMFQGCTHVWFSQDSTVENMSESINNIYVTPTACCIIF